jgi:hypothetical protein
MTMHEDLSILALQSLVADEVSVAVDSPVTDMAAAIAARHPGARAVLFYGSCLRETQLDGLMLDFYLIVADYAAAFDRKWLATANRLIPPNVFPFEHRGLIAQPSRLVWSADPAARLAAISAIAQCAPTLLAAARPCVGDAIDPLDLWRRAFALTYAAELRAERKTRAGSVVDADPERYRAFTFPALAAAGHPAHLVNGRLVFDHPLSSADRTAGERAWVWRRREGKALTLLRLAKASATYAGGLDYLAWKISRHSGQPIAISAWQRKWPIVGALSLLPRLIVKGAVR